MTTQDKINISLTTLRNLKGPAPLTEEAIMQLMQQSFALGLSEGLHTCDNGGDLT